MKEKKNKQKNKIKICRQEGEWEVLSGHKWNKKIQSCNNLKDGKTQTLKKTL